MSFQAYLDAIETKTGKTPRQILDLAKERGLADPATKAADVLAWLKAEFDLGRGHGMAIVHVLKHGDQISDKHVGSSGAHSDPSTKLHLDGKDAPRD